MAYKKKAKKTKQKIERVIAHIKSTFNNTMVSVTDVAGDVLMQSSSGRLGFKGSRKGTPFAGSQIGNVIAKELKALYGTRTVEVQVQGPGSGKESLIRSINASGLQVDVIRDVTPLPFNGCRPPKKRRV
jgi:small subunit ribosomal protein S11